MSPCRKPLRWGPCRPRVGLEHLERQDRAGAPTRSLDRSASRARTNLDHGRDPGPCGPMRNAGLEVHLHATPPIRCARSARRRWAIVAVHARGESWAQLMRMLSIPARNSSPTRAGSVAASVGTVTMIRVRRPGRGGPSGRRACRSISTRPPSGPREPSVVRPRCGRPERRYSCRRTLSRLSRTWLSACPSDERPSCVSPSWIWRASNRRKAK